MFTDRLNNVWQTSAISISASCSDVISALESLPNNVIPSKSVRCLKGSTVAAMPITDSRMTIVTKFTLAFSGNVGKIAQISINKYLDGTRPTLFSDETTSTLGWHVYANGFTGEDVDFVPDLCDGVLVTLTNISSTHTHTLTGLSAMTTKLLKTCLGDSDGNPANNVDVYNWDYGNAGENVTMTSGSQVRAAFGNPHLIKLVDATQDTTVSNANDPALAVYPTSFLCTSTTASGSACKNLNPPGFYAVLFYDGANFKIFTRGATDYSKTTQFHVFTTTGYLQRVSPASVAFSSSPTDSASTIINNYHSNKLFLRNSTYVSSTYWGAIDCETTKAIDQSVDTVVDCVNKNDYIMLLNVDQSANGLAANPIYPNIYQVKKISRELRRAGTTSTYSDETYRHQLVLDYGVNAYYSATTPAVVYKFHPPAGYEYAAQCSNRGLCDSASGICTCFAGYTGDDCSKQDALAL